MELINTKDKLERAVTNERKALTNEKIALTKERIAYSEVAKYKVMCDNLCVQIAGLIPQIQESEAEISALKDEIRVLRVATGNVPSAFH